MTANTSRPGLTALAVINLVYALAVIVFLFRWYNGAIQNPAGFWTIVVGGMGAILALLSGIGFLRRSRLLGYLCGNIFGGLQLVYAIGFLASRAVVNPMETFAWLSYPIILLLALNFLYRGDFPMADSRGGATGSPTL